MLFVILLPILLVGTFMIVGTYLAATAEIRDSAAHFGGAIADQLALTITDQVVQEDVLGLNVMLTDLQRKGDFTFASVYATDNRLLAQVGKDSDDLVSYTRDITFQNAALGSITLGLNTGPSFAAIRSVLVASLLSLLLVATVIGAAIAIYGDMVYLWFTAPSGQSTSGLVTSGLAGPGHARPGHATSGQPEAPPEPAEPQAPDNGLMTILVIKVRPARQLDSHRPRVISALSLYRGQLLDDDGEDLVMTFEQVDQVFRAICTGQLVRELMAQVRGNVTVRIGLHTIANDVDEREVDKAIKQATYLASIANNQLLASRGSQQAGKDTEGIQLIAFHSSLAPEGEVFCLDSLSDSHQRLISQQAGQLRSAR